MIAKVTSGSSGRGLIRYLFGPGQANEHTDQRVIAAGLVLGGDAMAGGNLSSQEIADIGAGLDAAHEAFGTNPKGGHIFHVSLSLPPGDRQLSDDQWAEIAHKAMGALGLEGEGKQPAAWVAIGHGTSANGNQHIHIAASLVRVDGSRVNTWQSKQTLSRLCAEIETDHGLTVIEGRAGKGMPGLSRAELERTAREQLAEPPRVTLARIVRVASMASKDEAEFVRRLQGSGALVRPRFESGGQEVVVGYSVAIREAESQKSIWFGGGKLAKDLTLPSLRQYWEVSVVQQKAAVAEWSALKSTLRGREAVLGGPADWQRAVAGIERTVETLKAIPASDLAVWRGAAREAAGVFAAWSRRFEGDSPGPMAAAADALARSAQSRPGEPVPSREAVPEFRGVASIVAQSELNNGSPIVWAMLIDQLGRTLRAIGDAHGARGEVEMAKVLVGDLSKELEVLHDRFEASSTRELVPGERTYEDRRAAAIAEMLEHQPRHRRTHGPSQGRSFGR
jgi:Relaxase/Mobilisation nuclease domain